MLARMLGLEGGVDCKISHLLERRTTSIGERNECHQRRWALKWVDCEISHRSGRKGRGSSKRYCE